jgi:lipopolysaccharide transport system ATP-binding protein
VAAHLDPEILIVDEVLAVGDIEFQQRCLGKMDEVASSGRTVLFVSHNMATVRQLTSRSLVLQQGQVAFLGGTEEAINLYTSHNRQAVSENSTGRRQDSSFGRIAKFESIRFLRPDAFFEEGEAIEFTAAVLSHEYTGNARLSLTLFRSDASPVGSCFSTEAIKLACGTTADFSVRLENLRLAPGPYYFAMSVGTGNNHTGFKDFDSVTDLLHFEIVRPLLKGGGMASWNSGWGAIRLPPPEITLRQPQRSGI